MTAEVAAMRARMENFILMRGVGGGSWKVYRCVTWRAV